MKAFYNQPGLCTTPGAESKKGPEKDNDHLEEEALEGQERRLGERQLKMLK